MISLTKTVLPLAGAIAFKAETLSCTVSPFILVCQEIQARYTSLYLVAKLLLEVTISTSKE